MRFLCFSGGMATCVSFLEKSLPQDGRRTLRTSLMIGNSLGSCDELTSRTVASSSCFLRQPARAIIIGYYTRLDLLSLAPRNPTFRGALPRSPRPATRPPSRQNGAAAGQNAGRGDRASASDYLGGGRRRGLLARHGPYAACQQVAA